MSENSLTKMNNHRLIRNFQFDGIQALRFFAAGLVVLTHSSFYAAERLGIHNLVWHNGARGVDLFFVISGFVMIISTRNILYTPSGWSNFCLQRLIRIVPMYWLATTIKVVVMLLSTGMVLHAELDVGNIIKSYLFIPYKKSSGLYEPVLGVGWTLVFEMFFYSVFTMALFLRANVYMFVGSIMGVFAILSLFRPANYPVWMYLWNPIVLEFLFGMFIGKLTLKEKFIRFDWALCLAIVSTIYLVFGSNWGLPSILVSGMTSVLLVYSIVSLEPYLQGKLPKAILFFGAASYSIYLFHPLILPAIPVVLNKLHLHFLGLSLILSCLTILIVGGIIYKHIELKVTRIVKGSIPFASQNAPSRK